MGTVLTDKHGQGKRLVYVETGAENGGTALILDAIYPPGQDFPPVHLHPEQDEHFTVREGILTVRIDEQERDYGVGESFAIPRGVAHTMANRGVIPVEARWQTRPALATGDFHETFYGLLNDGRLGAGERPSLLQYAVIARAFRREFVLARPSAGVQRVVFGLLAPLGRALGYRARYERYSGRPGTEVATITERVAIERPAADVFAYLADYAHDPEWRAAVVEMTQSAPGTATVGTTTREVFRSSGVTTVTEAEVVAVEPGRRIAFRSTKGAIPAWGDRLVEGTATGALVTYTLKLAPTGRYKLLAPILLPDLRKRVRADMVQLKALLESRPATVTPERELAGSAHR